MNFEENEGLSHEGRREKALKAVLDAISPSQENSWTKLDAATLVTSPDGPTLQSFSRKGIEGPNIYGLKFI